MSKMISYYGASCLRHASLWEDWKVRHYARRRPLFQQSTWPEHVLKGAEETKELAEYFWVRDIQEIRKSRAVICYAEEGDVLRGALVEVGAALGCSKHIILVAPHKLHSLSTWQWHPLVKKLKTLAEAFDWLEKLGV